MIVSINKENENLHKDVSNHVTSIESIYEMLYQLVLNFVNVWESYSWYNTCILILFLMNLLV